MRERRRHLSATPSAVAIGLWLVASGAVAHADVLLYRGQHVYLVPKTLGDRMTALAPAPEWRHFPAYTRRIDSNDDGRDDFLAIAIGAGNGHGVQIRYRLERHPGEGGERLGRWYWAVMTDASGESVFQSFNE